MSSKNAIWRLTVFALFILCIVAANAPAQTPAAKQTELETRVIALNYCVKPNFQNLKYVFNDLAELSSSLANYENGRDCREIIKEIDFSKYTLLGVDIYNPECQKFPLTHKVIRDEAFKLYRFQVTHPPVMMPCAGIYHHELWVLAPKMPKGYPVSFEISERISGETVPVLQKLGAIYPPCNAETAVYTEEKFNKMLADNKECAYLSSRLKPDFKTQTLIGIHLGGGCFISGAVKVFRSDKEKLYTVRIKNIWRGCRAGGLFQGWLLIEKIPADYRIRFYHNHVEAPRVDLEDDDELFDLRPVQTLETREINLNGCVQMFRSDRIVIRDKESFLKAIRNDASRERCVKDLEKSIDFGRFTLLGIDINSGYCRVPIGLGHNVIMDEAQKLYTLQVSYLAPQGVCRHMSSYDLWVLVPKMPEGYEATFEVKAVERDPT